ncbi:MAG: ABC transporter ATP-binding protein [Acidimicrobiia bacterium]
MSSTVTTSTLLSVDKLTVEFRSGKGWVAAVSDVAFDIAAGETLGLVGESGSGKTVTASAILGLTRATGGRISSGSVKLEGRELTSLSEKELSSIRGDQVGMIFQQPIRSLNPAFTIGEQIAETLRRHEGLGRKDAWARAVELLDRVQIANAAKRASEYPHMFSGGMCQRAMIAMAIACNPRLLIADEPTTALDVTVQSQVLDLIRELQAENNFAVLFISHDLAVIAEMCDRIAVMYAGQIVETAEAAELFLHPKHPYTEGLLGAIPKPGMSRTLVAIPGSVPSPGNAPQGCRFHPRCAHFVAGRCDTVEVPIERGADDHGVRCVRHAELSLKGITL